MPFPDLDEFALVSIPIFNVTESITIDKTKFKVSVKYITNRHNQIWSWSLTLFIIAFICCLLAALFQFIYWMNTPVKQ